jgi:hypothetical protein
MVLSTVVPTSFVGVDSFDIMIFRFIAGCLSLLLLEIESGRERRRLAISFDCSALN